MADEFDYDFFFSYAGEDWATIKPVVEDLLERGYKTWAYRDQKYPDTFKAIEKAIGGSQDFVLWVSKSWLSSTFCNQERNAFISLCGKNAVGVRRMFIVVLDDEGSKAVGKWYLNASDQKNRDYVRGETTPDQAGNLGKWLADLAALDRELHNAVEIPVAVLAMTAAEAADLPNLLTTVEGKACYKQLKRAMNNADPWTGYKLSRDEWTPLIWPEDPNGWPVAQASITASTTDVGVLVRKLIGGNSSPLGGGRSAPWVAKFYSDQLFNPDENIQDEAAYQIYTRHRGCAFIIDPISLLHPDLSARLGPALQTIDTNASAFVMVPPVGVYSHDVFRDLVVHTQSAARKWRNLFYGPSIDRRGELAVTGLHGLRRWLGLTIPLLAGAWTNPLPSGVRPTVPGGVG